MNPAFFYFLASVLIFASLAVVLARNPLYNVLSLVLAIFSLSSLFILLEAYFVGMVLLLVYAGAVLIFFLFVVMCLNLNTPTMNSSQQHRFRLLGWLTGSLFAIQLYIASLSILKTQHLPPTSFSGTIERIGKVLFTDYLLPFELTSILLLVAIVGIVALAKGVLTSGNDEGNA